MFEVEFLSSLSLHSKAVNCVRFGPKELLASCGDDNAIMIWQRDEASQAPAEVAEGEEDPGKEVWRCIKKLSGHAGNVVDVAWSPGGEYLVSGSVDNTAIVWHWPTGRKVQIMNDHTHYVQGVLWDPRDDYVATISCDRAVRFFARRKKPNQKGELFALQTSLRRRDFEKDRDEGVAASEGTTAEAPAATVPGAASAPAPAAGSNPGVRVPRSHALFADEGTSSFFRRGAWAPDGSVVILPAGLYKEGPSSPSEPACFGFRRDRLDTPLFRLCGFDKPVLVMRFSPVTYRSSASPSGYALVYAVASAEVIGVYSTDSATPLAVVADTHRASITDISFSPTGNLILFSSSDGYCSVAEFSDGELGTPVPASEVLPAQLLKDLADAAVPESQRKPPASAAKSAAKDEVGKDETAREEVAAAPVGKENDIQAAPAENDIDQEAEPALKKQKTEEPCDAPAPVEEIIID